MSNGKNKIGMHVGLHGEFKFVLKNADGSIADIREFSNNRILDNGLVIYKVNDPFNLLSIGSDGTATNDTQTALGSFLASEVNDIGITTDTIVGPDYERRGTATFRFSAGEGTGTIREVGIGIGSSGTNLFCRQVVSPEIVKSADQTLDVTWALTKYPSLTDATGTVVIDGITYDWSAGFYDVTSFLGSHFRGFGSNVNKDSYKVYSGTKANLTGQSVPNGTNLGSATFGTFVETASGSGFQDYEWTYGLSVGNGTLYARTVTMSSWCSQKLQVQFTQQAGQPNPGEGIPKDNTEEMTLEFRHTWGRHTP